MLKNRINTLFESKKNNILNIYFTAGYPQLNDTQAILESLQTAGADMVEIGIPFSDPIADGETIQASSGQALQNGMSLQLLFEQLQGIRERVHLPLLLMGYLNPILQYGMEAFCKKCQEIGIDGLILPDLPLFEYQSKYKALFEQHGLHNTFLITPQTSSERIEQIDRLSSGFVYMVSSASTTGAKQGLKNTQLAYFERVRKMKLQNPTLIGFGISDAETFQTACQYAQGAIIGSAFIKALGKAEDVKASTQAFVSQIRK